MKRLFVLGMAATVLVAAAALSRNYQEPPPGASGDMQVEVGERNPWTHLRLNNDPGEFQFVIISDRTGGHRAKVFARAVERINLLQPEFVLSVGDLIEGYSTDKDKLTAMWTEFDRFVNRLEMPFFYVPGNHDISNPKQEELWREKYGRRYYHFVYRDVLFLALDSEDPPEKKGTNISAEQIAYVKKALADNAKVRWTVVSLHKPLWVYDDGEKNGWGEVEKLLAGRKYTVFAGHVHRFQKFVRQGMNYYQLATTGGGSKLRGTRYGEFDHVAWVTMKKDGPVIANVMLDGIYPEDLSLPDVKEPGHPRKMRPTYPVNGKLAFKGKPLANATVVFYSYNEKTKKYSRVADALAESDGSFKMSTYKAFDGVPKGEYAVTVTLHEPRYDPSGKLTPNKLPDKYARPEVTPLKVSVEEGENIVNFRLSP